jgi:hypothetical protein
LQRPKALKQQDLEKSGKCEFAAFFVPENSPNITDNSRFTQVKQGDLQHASP